MAERRMISKSIVTGTRFLRMPVSARELYFQLVLDADDDGVVEAFKVMRMTGASDGDLGVLIMQEFVIPLDMDDLIFYIKDWNEQNKLRADRKSNSRYIKLLHDTLPDVEVVMAKPRSDRPKSGRTIELTEGTYTVENVEKLYEDNLGRPMDSHGTATGQSMDGIVEDSIGKDSKVKISRDKSKEEKDNIESTHSGKSNDFDDEKPKRKPRRKRYGEYGHVLLTDDDLEKLKAKFPSDWQDWIRKLDEGIELKGYKYTNFYLAILNWAKREEKKPKAHHSMLDSRFYESTDDTELPF